MEKGKSPKRGKRREFDMKPDDPPRFLDPSFTDSQVLWWTASEVLPSGHRHGGAYRGGARLRHQLEPAKLGRFAGHRAGGGELHDSASQAEYLR